MPAGRPLQFDPDIALEKAMRVFWSQGYDSTSLKDLLAATGLSKSSLYQEFDSKKSLFERSIDRYLDDLAREMLGSLGAAESGRQFIEDTFRGLVSEAGRSSARDGCMLWNTAVEFGQRDRAIAQRIERGIWRFAAVFAAAVERAQRDGDVDAARDPEALGMYLMSGMAGVRSLLKAGLDADNVDNVIDEILAALD